MRRFYALAVVLMLCFSACSGSPATTGKEAKETKETRERDPLEPCHPGCFPSGTMITTLDGPRPIESIREGDPVTLIGDDGTATSGKVGSTFQTCNRLVEVQTDFGTLLTTRTQPLCLRDGGFRRASDLAEGDYIWRWQHGERQAARVKSVTLTGRETQVFNLVVGESNVFVAGEFLARGKPPPVE
jgi:hypothetical protein